MRRPSRASHAAGAGRPLPRQSAFHKAGLVFRPTGVHAFSVTSGGVRNMLGNCFYPTLWGVLHAPEHPLLHSLHRAVPATPADTANEIRPLTSPPSLPELRGTYVEAAYAFVGTVTIQGVRTLCALLHTLEMYWLLSTPPACIYSCVYVINDQLCFTL